MSKKIKTSEELENRREILFAYEAKDSNPNGDPDSGNLPRMDDEGYNIVTDLRLKRTIRDYWDTVHHGTKSMEILVKQKYNPEGNVMSMAHLALEKLKLKNVSKKEGKEIRQRIIKSFPKEFIDVRCFGAAVTLENANASITGPVQFNIGRSLNRPNVITYGLSASLSSGEGKGAGTLGEFHVVDYSLILFHGIACELSAKITGMTENDILEVYRGMWWGTKALNTRSKSQQIPRFLVSAVSKQTKFQIGDLWRHVKIDKEDGILRIDDAIIDISALVTRLKENNNSLERIEYYSDDQTTFRSGDELTTDLEKLLTKSGIPIVRIGM